MAYLIVGLGNPGDKYRDTRHNVGFQIVEALAKKQGWTFRSAPSLEAELAKESEVFLLKPMTYMNLSGHAVRKTMDYYKLPMSSLLVVTDDIYTPFGRFRLRLEGSAGGHNGLKSIEESLGSREYARLRVGIGQDCHVELKDYVLDTYRKEERELFPQLLEQAVLILGRVLELGIEKTLQYANTIEVGMGEKKNG
jgi:PTH1 family peptidyl-tRNA hydrolase